MASPRIGDSGFQSLLKKATGVLEKFGIGDQLKFPGKDGELLYSKNNVCVHPAIRDAGQDQTPHHPGYLTIHCQTDEALGVTLVLQWMPNATLERNPRSIQTISPRVPHTTRLRIRQRRRDSSSESSGPELDPPTEEETPVQSPDTLRGRRRDSESSNGPTSPDIDVRMNGDELTVTSTARPRSLPASLPVPEINVIPHTPMEPAAPGLGEDGDGGSTSGADEDGGSSVSGRSTPYSPDAETAPSAAVLAALQSVAFLEKSPEEFAGSRNLILPDGLTDDVARKGSYAAAATPGLFSVDLGKMRTLRLFYSDAAAGAGQLVVASCEGRYKILHFHHGGLDKVASILEQWSAVRARSIKGTPASPEPFPNQQFGICAGKVGKGEEHPEEGLYEPVSWEFWRASTAADGSIQEAGSLKKAIFFAGLEESIRHEAWPFLLRLFPWDSTREDREQIRNDLYLQYQRVRKRREDYAKKVGWQTFQLIDSAILKDVVRTDRKHPYYEGDDNPHMEIMHNILLNYAAFCPVIGYIQGMSDLLAPVLVVLDAESDAFWAFTALMQRSVFVSLPKGNDMEKNLEYLGELLKLLCPAFSAHLHQLGGDAPSFMFAHRWILLCFKREFGTADSMKLWEACWSGFAGDYFHLFVACGVVGAYGADVVSQSLPHDEILLYFASLAHHMDPDAVFRKARGLLDRFYRLERIPCTLGGLAEGLGAASGEEWEGRSATLIDCVLFHGEGEPCPYRR